MEQINRAEYIDAVKAIKEAIQAWSPCLNWQPSVADLKNVLPFDQLVNRQPKVADLSAADMECFVQVGFSLHRQIIRYASSLEERLFYIRQCKLEMQDPERLAYWQDRYLGYRKAAAKHVGRANSQYIGTTSDKFYSTLRGFIIASLSAQLKQN